MSAERTAPAPSRIRRNRRRALVCLGVVVASVVPAAAAGAAGITSSTTALPVTSTTTTRTVPSSTTTTTTAPVSTTTTPTAPAPAAGGVRVPALASVSAYWVVASDGGVFAFGGAPFYGSAGGIRLNQPVVGMAPTSPTDFGGYREVAADGGVFTYGDAKFFGSAGNLVLNRPIVGMAATPSGRGYWLVASDGGVFAYGDAAFHGSAGNLILNQPVVGMAATSDGGGYWLVAADGGVFAYGDARFYGSAGNLPLVSPIVSMISTGTGHGYYMGAADGGVFSYGDAAFHGSLGGVPQSRPIVGMAATADKDGYWFTNNNGAVTPLGDATYWGSTPQVLAAPVVGITEAPGTGATTDGPYPSGSYGYDISLYQCQSFPPPPYTIGIVQVEEPGFPVNPCLAQEARWAGGGLNLYIYANYGTGPYSGDPNCANMALPAACDYGFSAAIHAYDDAVVAGVDTSVPWWLDVEDGSFQGHQTASAGLVQGMIDGLHYAGINSVGIYASPGNWNGLVGYYRPAVPYWAADWSPPPASTCASVNTWYPNQLPTGPVAMVQYGVGTINGNQYDLDYAC